MRNEISFTPILILTILAIIVVGLIEKVPA